MCGGGTVCVGDIVSVFITLKRFVLHDYCMKIAVLIKFDLFDCSTN